MVVDGWAEVLDETGKSHWKRAIIMPRIVKITRGRMVIQVPCRVNSQITVPAAMRMSTIITIIQRILWS